MRIRMNRDSVAMGDDFESHETEWELPDDAKLGHLVVRTFSEGYLPSVAGSIAWILESARSPMLILVQIDYPSGERWVTPLAYAHAQLDALMDADPDGSLAFTWRYHTDGRRLPWDAFHYWMTETPDQRRLRVKERAREVIRRNRDRIREHAERWAAKKKEGRG